MPTKTLDEAKQIVDRLLSLVPAQGLAIIFDPADEVLPYDSYRVIRDDSIPNVTGQLIEIIPPAAPMPI